VVRVKSARDVELEFLGTVIELAMITKFVLRLTSFLRTSLAPALGNL
jgi:hypothetical protein